MVINGRLHIESWDKLSTNLMGVTLSFEFFKPQLLYNVITPNPTVKSFVLTYNGGLYSLTTTMTDNSTDTISASSPENAFSSYTPHTAPVDWFGKITVTDAMLLSLLIDNGVIIPNDNILWCYTLDSPKDHVTKSITPVRAFAGNFNRPISLKNVTIDLEFDSIPDFNYVYINTLNRYYYVASVSQTKDIMTLELVEDVLMSFDALIRLQTAYVERNENTYSNYLVDDLITYDYEKEITVETIAPLVTIFPTDLTESARFSYVLTVVSTI